jgi:hypothetical protein
MCLQAVAIGDFEGRLPESAIERGERQNRHDHHQDCDGNSSCQQPLHRQSHFHFQSSLSRVTANAEERNHDQQQERGQEIDDHVKPRQAPTGPGFDDQLPQSKDRQGQQREIQHPHAGIVLAASLPGLNRSSALFEQAQRLQQSFPLRIARDIDGGAIEGDPICQVADQQQEDHQDRKAQPGERSFDHKISWSY